MPTVEYASFLIRLWRLTNEGPDKPPSGWRSEAVHIQSGRHWSFDSLEGLQEFFREQAEHADLLSWQKVPQDE